MRPRQAVIFALITCLNAQQQLPNPSATIAQDPATGMITAVVSMSKTQRLVCKYAPQPPGPIEHDSYTSLNTFCTVNDAPTPIFYAQLVQPYDVNTKGVTYTITANSAPIMSIAAIFVPMPALPPGTVNAIQYQIAANNAILQGVIR